MRRFLAETLSHLPFLFPNEPVLVNYVGGKIYLNLRESVNVLYRAFSVYEPQKTKLFQEIVKPNMVCVDVGVHKGYFSLLFAKLMQDNGRVLAFEPEPENCFVINASVKANGYKCIELFPYALSNEDGFANFYRGKQLGWGSFFKSKSTTSETILVKTRKLDNVLEDEGIIKVDVMKVDVEGADLLVLRGAEETLRRGVHLVMDVDVKTVGEREELFSFLKSLGYRVFAHGKRLTPIENTYLRRYESIPIYATK